MEFQEVVETLHIVFGCKIQGKPQLHSTRQLAILEASQTALSSIAPHYSVACGNTVEPATAQIHTTKLVKFPTATRLLATIIRATVMSIEYLLYLGPTAYIVSSETPPRFTPPVAQSCIVNSQSPTHLKYL